MASSVGAVAQLVRALDCRSRGCGFEPRRPRFGFPKRFVDKTQTGLNSPSAVSQVPKPVDFRLAIWRLALVAREPGCCLHKPTGQAYVNLGEKVVYLGKHGTAEC